jgi:transposase
MRFLLLGWEPQLIADREGCSRSAVYNVMKNLKKHGSIRKPPTKRLRKPPKIADEDAKALFEQLVCAGWMYQDEIAKWLLVERGVKVNHQTVSNFLCSCGWNWQTLRPYSIDRNEELRESYRRSMRQFAADDLVFLDESIFNEKTGWRHHVYAPVGHKSRYTQNIKRGDTWTILPAYTIHGYLPCTAIKEGYFSKEDFIEWIQNSLISTLRSVYGPKHMVVILDNVSIHTNDEVEAVIQAAGYSVRYLPPYSPDYNPICYE